MSSNTERTLHDLNKLIGDLESLLKGARRPRIECVVEGRDDGTHHHALAAAQRARCAMRQVTQFGHGLQDAATGLDFNPVRRVQRA